MTVSTSIGGLLATLAPVAVLAAGPVPFESTAGDAGLGLGMLGLRVLLVLALLAGVLWLMKTLKIAPGRLAGGPGPLAVVAARSLGPRRQVVLVRVGRKVLVLGVSEAGVRTLESLDETQSAEILGSGSGEPDPPAPGAGFAGILAALRSRTEGGPR